MSNRWPCKYWKGNLIRTPHAGWMPNALRQRIRLMSNLSFIDPPSLRSTDSSPIRGTSLELLDMDKVACHIDRAVERGRYTGPTTAKEYLLRKQCIVEVEDTTY